MKRKRGTLHGRKRAAERARLMGSRSWMWSFSLRLMAHRQAVKLGRKPE